MHRETPPSAIIGCYGLRLTGVEAGAHLLGAVPESWPELRLTCRDDPEGARVRAGDPEHLDERTGRFRLPGGGDVTVDRASSTAVYTFPTAGPVDHRHLIHPFMATTCAAVNRWLGRDGFHAGAFVWNGGAWAVLGDKGQGKSTLLALLAQQGVPVLADDLLVLDGGQALRGPGCIDLRQDAAVALGGAGEDLGVVGARARARLALPVPPGQAPLRGWIFPEWAPEISVTSMPAARRLPGLYRNLSLRLPPPRPERFLAYAGMPTYVLSRPRSWDAAGAASAALLESLPD